MSRDLDYRVLNTDVYLSKLLSAREISSHPTQSFFHFARIV